MSHFPLKSEFTNKVCVKYEVGLCVHFPAYDTKHFQRRSKVQKHLALSATCEQNYAFLALIFINRSTSLEMYIAC